MASFLRSHGGAVVGVVLLLAPIMMMMWAASAAPDVGGAREVHHVVGSDRGWDVKSDIAGWSSGRVFRVGDSIWFTYSAAAEGRILELGSREEFDACDAGNPIRMYTDGLNKVALDGEGHRYFVSSDPESCRDGMRLHVEVLPPPSQLTEEDEEAGEQKKQMTTTTTASTAAVPATGPTPSDSGSTATGPTPSGSGSARLTATATAALVWTTLALLYSVGLQ